MKHKDIVDGVEVEFDDGDEATEDITELHGKLAEQADDEMVKSWIRDLKKRGYTIIPPAKKKGKKVAWTLEEIPLEYHWGNPDG